MKQAYLKMHLCVFLWGFTGLLGKKIELNEGLLVWYRLLFSIIVMAMIIFSRKKFPKLQRKEWIQICSVGLLVMIHWVLFYGSIKAAGISVAMICLSSIAVFAALLEPLINKQKYDAIEIVFSLLAIGGIFVIYATDQSSLKGIILGVTSSFFSALFGIFNKKLTAKHESLTIGFLEMSSGLLILTLLLPLYFLIQPTEKFLPNQSDTIYLILLSVVCTVLTWILSLQALRKVSAYTLSLALNLEPVYGILLAVIFAKEILTGGFITGAIIILLTVVLHTVYHYRKNKNKPLIA